MGIVNVTPDSFSDGGDYLSVKKAINTAEKMIKDGVDIIDVGGESTRPGSVPITIDEEWLRISDVLKQLVKFDTPISVDTSKPSIMMKALDTGVDILNDVSGFQTEESLKVVESANLDKVGFCVMHMQGTPETMQSCPRYVDVVAEVEHFLLEKKIQLNELGTLDEQIIIDPGFGFGKTYNHNFLLLKSIKRLKKIAPLLVGVSRKRIVSEMCDRKDMPKDRVGGSLAVALWSLIQGASIIRVHDVKESVDLVRVLNKLN